MLPTVIQMTALDIYRDGGSLSASFHAEDKSEYTLFFPIDHDLMPDNGIAIKKYYKQPILKKHIRTEYMSPITGIASPEWKEEETSISWKEARNLLQHMEPHLENLVSDYLHVFEYMQEAVLENGNE